MALPRLLRSKVKGNNVSSLSSFLRTQKFFNHNCKCGSHAAPFLYTRKKSLSNAFLKSIYAKNSFATIYLNAHAKPLDNSNSLDLVTSPKSLYNVLSFSSSNNDSDGSRKRDGDGEQGQFSGDEPKKDPLGGGAKFLLFLVLATLPFWNTSLFGSSTPETSWSTFLRLMLQTGEVEHLTVSREKDRVYVHLHQGAVINGLKASLSGPHFYFTIGNLVFEERLQVEQEKLGIHPNNFIPVTYTQPVSELKELLMLLEFTIILAAGIFYVWKKVIPKDIKFPFSMHTRAKPTIILPEKGEGVAFKDVAGMHEAKEEVREFIDYLKYPDRFKELGAKMPKGALLSGPPGTGKTLLAKAVSTEAAVPFLAMSGSDFVEMFGGVGPARVRDLFAQARKHAPCIVYIDEVDAIGKSRKSSSAAVGGGLDEQESTLNQLLVEMDGMNSVEGVLMLASTNRPDVLDNALLRPGRFDRNINIDVPTLLERQEIFEIYLAQLKLGEGLRKHAKRLAELTPGKTGADIANVCNEAALHAARLSGKVVNANNFEYAIERVIAGLQRNNNPLSSEERNMVAYHEAGHVIVNWMLKHTEPIIKISTIPRTHSPLGFIQKFPLGIKLHTNEQLFDMMCYALGGRVAESLKFGRITTGAKDDLKQVTDLAYKQIAFFGMNKRIGPISFPPREKGEARKKPYSDNMASKMDDEASLMVAKAHKVAEQILQENRDKLDLLASTLLEKEVLNYDELVSLIGQSPHGDKMKNYYSNQLNEESETGFKPDSGRSE